MRSSEVDILIVPGLGGGTPDHWYARWQAKLSTARRIEQDDWERPVRDQWVARIVAAAARASRPVVLVAHSLGVLAVVHAAPRLGTNVAGAFLVTPPDETSLAALPQVDPAFVPIPRQTLPFPAVLIASSDDPYCGVATATALGRAWGARFVDAGAAGHINDDSGHGPWPEGLMRFAGLLQQIGRD